MNRSLFSLLLCVFLCSGAFQKVYSWWDVPHMLITQIAKKQLDPSTIKKIELLIEYFKDDFPESSSFLTASCFPDDITSLGLSGFKVWHGVLTPYSVDGFLSEKEIGCIEPLISYNNLHSAIRQSIKTLKNPAASQWEKCFLLRFLLHTVADIHQPLHCIQLYSAQFPKGDLAGHQFLISGMPYRNLHLLWDAALGIGKDKLQRPLNTRDLKWLEELAESIMKTYPPENLSEKDNMDILEWSKESYKLAIEVVYAGIEPGQVPSQQYLSRGKQAALRQIALAGYRLANLLEEIFKEN
jgi:S1/P1 Nuclease